MDDDIAGQLHDLIRKANRFASLPCSIHAREDFILRLRQRSGERYLTPEQLHADLVESPLATDIGGGWWSIVTGVRDGDHCQLPGPDADPA